MAALSQVKGFSPWPIDMGYQASEVALFCNDCQIFRRHELPDVPDAATCTYAALVASIAALVGEHVRLLFYKK